MPTGRCPAQTRTARRQTALEFSYRSRSVDAYSPDTVNTVSEVRVYSLNMLEVTGLHKRYGDLVAVEDVSFAAKPGEMVGLLGPNGAGKTTTVSMIAGLLAPDRGEVRIEGGVVRAETDPVKLRLGLVPQEVALHDELSARENLALVRRHLQPERR